MFGKKEGEEINEGAGLSHTDQQCAEGGYGSSELGSERRPIVRGARMFLIVVLVVVVAIPVILSLKAWSVRKNTKDSDELVQRTTVEQVIPSYTPRVIREEPEEEPQQEPQRELRQDFQEEPSVTSDLPTKLVENIPLPWSNQGAVSPQSDGVSDSLIRERMLNSSLTPDTAISEDSSEKIESASSGSGNRSALFRQLQPMQLSGSRAGRLHNRDLLITQGTQLDCVLGTKIITTQPGMATCYLTRDVYSTSGRVVLLDRGSKIIGFYESGVLKGQDRVFVRWSRVETPSGVVIDLDSPGAGPLGEAGIGGSVDRHLWERVGSALMVTLIDVLGHNLNNRFEKWLKDKLEDKNKTPEKKGGSEEVQSPDIQSAASVLTGEIGKWGDIPPTLYKNQGERISIFVARDLDFSNVYTLAAD